MACSRRHKSLRSVVHAAAFSCFSMGFNSGIIAGALLYLEEHFSDIKKDPTLKGFVTASVFASAFLANVVVVPLADRFGRTIILTLINIPFVAGAVVAASAPTANMLIVGRVISGFAVGIAGSLPNLYIAEIVPPESRGRWVGMAPLHGTTGIMAAQFVSFFIAQALGHDRCCEIGWRIMFGAGALPSVIQLFWSLGLPESPRWCRQRGLYEKADENTEYLVSLGCGIDTLTRSLSQNSIGTNGSRGGDPDKIGVQRGAIAVGLSVMQQLSGVNAVVFYAPILYKQLGMASNIAILIAGCNSVAQVLMTRLMTVIIDSWGRRCICLIGLMGMFIGLVVLGSVFSHLLNVQVFVVNICAVVGVLIFRLSFSLSLGPLPYIMVTELFPQRHRARGVAMSMMTNWLLNWGVVLSVPILMHNFDGMVFFGFAGVCVVSGIIVDLYLPETAGVDLDDDDGANMHQGTIRKVCKTLSKVFRRSASREPSLLGQNASDNSDLNSVASGVPSEVNSGVPSENSGLPKTANAQKVDVQDAVKKVLDNKV